MSRRLASAHAALGTRHILILGHAPGNSIVTGHSSGFCRPHNGCGNPGIFESMHAEDNQMRNTIAVPFIAVLLSVTGAAQSRDAQVAELAGKALSELLSGDYAAFYGRFDDKMKAAIPQDKLPEIWKGLTAQAGAFKSRLATRQEKSGPLDVVILTCRFEIAALDVQLVFNAQRQISGLFFRPAAAAGQKRPQDPQKPYPYIEEEVAYDSREPGVRLAGTLTLPVSGGPFPAVVLISGSGTQNRNGEIMGHKLFLVLADHLTRKGIAVLRVDDRGIGGSSAGPFNPTTLNFAQDVRAGLDYLKSRKEIDPGRIGLIGHSEGGILAPMIAADSSDVAFIVLMAGTGVPGEEVLVRQGELLLRAGGAPEKLISENTKSQRILFEIMRTTPDDTEAEKKAREAFSGLDPAIRDAAYGQLKTAFSAWMRFFVAYDPRPALGKVKCPVLAINGEKDLQVSARQNLPEIEKALRAGGNRDFRTVELPGLNHLFQTCKTGAVAEYSQIEETIAPAALELISGWILEKSR